MNDGIKVLVIEWIRGRSEVKVEKEDTRVGEKNDNETRMKTGEGWYGVDEVEGEDDENMVKDEENAVLQNPPSGTRTG